MTLFDDDFRLRLALVLLLLGAYLLVYVAAPPSIDGMATLAVGANLARFGRADVGVLAAQPESVAARGVDGALYSKKGVTPSLLLIPVTWLADALPWLSLRALAMLLNPLLTALTGALVYSLARRIGARPAAAFLGGLIFGLSTLALVYVKTLFGEPLAALLLILAVWAAHRYQAASRPRDAALAGAALGLALGVNLTYAVMLPLVGLYLFGADPRRWRVRPIAAFGAPVLAALLLLGAYNWARFGGPLETGYATGLDEGFTSGLLPGVIGLLVGPYRGLVWYSPVLLLAIPGGLRLGAHERGAPRLAGLIAAIVIAQVLVYATWWSWHGGVTWGPRFLLPVVPLLAVAVIPLVEAALDRARLAAVALIGLVALSLGVQLAGALISYLPYQARLATDYPAGPDDHLITGLADAVYFDPRLSPIVGHLSLLAAGEPLEPAWLADGVDPIVLLAALAVLGGGAALIRWPGRRTGWIALAIAALALNVIPARQGGDAQTQAARALADSAGEVDALLVASDRFGSALLDIQGPRVLAERAPGDDFATHEQWTADLAEVRRVGGLLAYVTWFPPADAGDWRAGTLWPNEPFVREGAGVSLNGVEHRVLVFTLAPEPATFDHDAGWRLGPLAIAGYDLHREPGGVYLGLMWQSMEAHDQPLTWFVHLLDAGGTVVAQQDRAPVGGLNPTTDWPLTLPVVADRLYFPLPAGTDTGGWAVRIGVLDPATGAPFPAEDAEGNPLPDPFVVIPLEP